MAGQIHSSESTHSPFESICLLRGRQRANILPGFLRQLNAFASRQHRLSQQEEKCSDGGPSQADAALVGELLKDGSCT